MSNRDLDEMADRMFVAVKSYIDSQLRGLDEAMKALDKRQSTCLRFEGAHLPHKDYKAGSLVQRGGASFVALIDTKEMPGASLDWRRVGEYRV